MKKTAFAYIPSSHLDLYWLGNYKTCLERGAEIIRQYVERCTEHKDETFLIETTVFTEYFCRRYPELAPALKQLVAEGRIEVGSAFVDRWETLVPAESLIRNVQIGKEYCKATFGINNPMATHPDLPSMTPQIAQIYAQAGIDYYVTSRKVFQNGQVWRYRSPDGSTILVLNYPRHYVFTLVDLSDAPGDTGRRLWTTPVDLEPTKRGFPLGTIIGSGSAGDLADRVSFLQRYGRQLEDYITLYRTKYPSMSFGYTTPSRALSPYKEFDALPTLTGQIPSVWGVSCDEEATFFQRDRLIEGRLLTAETLAVMAASLNIDWLPETADGWQGTYYEGAFFAEKNPFQPGREWAELWRMHIFTQDHNGGGQEGALSTFQKRTIQERLLLYTGQIIDAVLQRLATRLGQEGQKLLVFNPHGQDWARLGGEPISVPAPEGWAHDSAIVDEKGETIPVQMDASGQLHLLPQAIPAIGYRAYRAIENGAQAPAPSADITTLPGELRLSNTYVDLSLDLHTGNLTRLVDRSNGQDWGGAQVGGLSVWEESGNDVTLRVTAGVAPVRDELESVRVTESGPLYTRIEVKKRLFHCDVQQSITVWNHAPRVDLHTRLFWWGSRNRQVRLQLPGGEERRQITCGAPFYGANWTDIVEGTGPYNGDEISPEDQMAYREVIGWLHLTHGEAGLTIFTGHPGFYQGEGGLSAVLLRTAPSCGDGRLYWENAGEQNFHFALKFGGVDWQAAGAPLAAEAFLRPPAARWVSCPGAVVGLPESASFLRCSDLAVLSALHPDKTGGKAVARLWNPSGKTLSVSLSGTLANGTAQLCDLLENPEGSPSGAPGDWVINLAPWAIRTLILDPGASRE